MVDLLTEFSDEHLSQIDALIRDQKTQSDMYSAIVNAPFSHKVQAVMISLGIIVLLLVDENNTVIKRIALSNNDMADATKNMSVKKFEEILIPLNSPDNIIARAIREETRLETIDWKYLFTPELTVKEARLNQAAGAISYSVVNPLISKNIKGALIFSYHQFPKNDGKEQYSFMDKYSKLITLILDDHAAYVASSLS